MFFLVYTVGEKLLGFEALHDWRFFIPIFTEISYPLLHGSDSITWNCGEENPQNSKKYQMKFNRYLAFSSKHPSYIN
jgi:predicted molibdopterin-dependent oxidoreductase YjgC